MFIFSVLLLNNIPLFTFSQGLIHNIIEGVIPVKSHSNQPEDSRLAEPDRSMPKHLRETLSFPDRFRELGQSLLL